MHRALELPDILYIIYDHLITSDDEFLEKEDQWQFLQLALTCRTFLPAALDNLWSNMYSITPLLQLLPTFIVSTNPDREGYILHGKPSQEIWDIFDTYAVRIRCISLTPRDRVHASLYEALLLWHPTPLLPRLRGLYWRGLDLSVTEAMLFMSPSIKRLRFMLFQYPEQDGGTLMFLNRMPETSLEELALWGKLTPACLAVPQRFTNLRTLYVWESYRKPEELVIDDHYTTALKMKQLTSLSLRVPLGYTFTSSDLLVLDDLEYLCIQGAIDALTQVFTVLSAGQLWELNFKIDTHHSPEGDYPALLSSLRFPNLHVLEIMTTNEDRNELTHDYADIIKPLLRLKQLEDLHVNFPSDNIRLNDSNIESMAKAWPHLKQLGVVTYGSLMGHPDTSMMPTLGALRHLARHCPDLQLLQIQVNASGECPEVRPSRLNHGLHTINLYSSPIHDVRKVALWIDSVFPNIEEWRRVDGILEDGWQAVSDLLNSFRMEGLRKTIV